MSKSTINDQAIIRLSALWALVEITLGGVLHAMRIPLTGLFVGSMALACVYLIARSTTSYRVVLQAMVSVMAIKMMATPHASPFSYVAMAIQTLCCIPLIGHKGHSRKWVTSMFLLASLYSPMQKIVILYITFGHQGLMVVLEEFRKWLAPGLTTTELMLIPLVLWLGIHLVAGFFLAKWLHTWVAQGAGKQELHDEWIRYDIIDTHPPYSQRRSTTRKVLLNVAVVLIVVLLYLYESVMPTWIHVLWRPLFIILFWQLIFRPIISIISKRWTSGGKDDGNVQVVMDELPRMWSIIKFARRKSSDVVGWVDRYYVFLKVTILLSVMNSTDNIND